MENKVKTVAESLENLDNEHYDYVILSHVNTVLHRLLDKETIWLLSALQTAYSQYKSKNLRAIRSGNWSLPSLNTLQIHQSIYYIQWYFSYWDAMADLKKRLSNYVNSQTFTSAITYATSKQPHKTLKDHIDLTNPWGFDWLVQAIEKRIQEKWHL